jgi:hypothetical protein
MRGIGGAPTPIEFTRSYLSPARVSNRLATMCHLGIKTDGTLVSIGHRARRCAAAACVSDVLPAHVHRTRLLQQSGRRCPECGVLLKERRQPCPSATKAAAVGQLAYPIAMSAVQEKQGARHIPPRAHTEI